MDRRNVRVVVRGRVQGVGFRYATQRRAQQLGVSGWVRNTADGTVEIVAVAAASEMEAFLAWCGRGPVSARVSGITVEESDAPCRFSRFEIRPTLR